FAHSLNSRPSSCSSGCGPTTIKARSAACVARPDRTSSARGPPRISYVAIEHATFVQAARPVVEQAVGPRQVGAALEQAAARKVSCQHRQHDPAATAHDWVWWTDVTDVPLDVITGVLSVATFGVAIVAWVGLRNAQAESA